jgi:hypothetical protein
MKKTLALSCALFACEATGFEPEYVVDTLRVLGVQADLPLAEPGENVHFTTMWADPNGGGRPIAWAWGTCLNPGSSQIPDCAAVITNVALGTDSFSATVPANALDGVVAGEFGVVFAACAGTITLAPNRATGAPVTCTDASGAVGRQGFVWGGTRVIVVKGLRNANPGIDQVFIDGNSWGKNDAVTLDPTVTHAITYTQTDGSAETYDIGTGPTTEQLVGWFYVTQGTLVAGYASPDASGAFDMTYTAPATDRTRPVHLFLVLRDDRGGLAQTDRQFSWK